MQCAELFNFLSKDVVGARSLQGLGRLDEHLEKKKNPNPLIVTALSE